MSSKVIDLRIRKIEKLLDPDGFDHLTDSQLDDLIGQQIVVLAAEHDGNVFALRDEIAALGTYDDKRLADHLTATLESLAAWQALFPDAPTIGHIPESQMPV